MIEGFLASIAGIDKLLLKIFAFFFGTYINFIARIKWMKLRYKFISISQDDDDDK